MDQEMDIAIEGFFDFFKKKSIDEDIRDSWYNKLLGGKGFFGKVPMIGKRNNVEVRNGEIIISGINYATLKARIKKHYEDKSIYNIFIPKYNALSYRRFEAKKIGRADIKIDYMHTEEFFALELVKLFNELGRRFRDTNYIGMANKVYRQSWLAEADRKAESVPLLDTTNLRNLALTLNDYQVEFIEKYPKLKAQLNLRGYILAFEQGLGKTLTATGLSECLNVDHVYIVCPNSLKENWALEIKKYYSKYQKDEDLWRQEVFICSDKPIFFDKNTTRFLIINNESIEKMFPYVMSGRNMLILDESHNFRNVNSKRVSQLLTLRDNLNCVDTLIMSGTPIKATPDEIVPALLMIDPTFTMNAAKTFSKAFKLHSSLGTSLVQARFGKIIYRKEKDVLEGQLPEKIMEAFPLKIREGTKYMVDNVMSDVFALYSQIYEEGLSEFRSLKKPFFDMSKKYKPSDMSYDEFYALMKRFVQMDREAMHEIDIEYMEKYMRLVKEKIRVKAERDRYDYLIKNYVRYPQHCLGIAFGKILPPYRRDMFIALYNENADIFHHMIRNNVKKSLIFTQFKGVANHIFKSLNDAGIGSVLITGDVTNRMPVLQEFKENDSIRVLVATSQTIGTGVTLTEANQMFFFGPPWRDSDFAQCSDRIHRIGQTDTCYIYTVTLDTGDALNLSTRMDNILAWSKNMTESVIVKTDDEADIDETHFKEILATESFADNEFMLIPEKDQLVIRPEIPNDSFSNVFRGRDDFLYTVYEALYDIPSGVTIYKDAIVYYEHNPSAVQESLIAKELQTYESIIDNPNVIFEKHSDMGRVSYDLVTLTPIGKGTCLQLQKEKIE